MTADIRSLGKPGFQFTNWATTYSCRPELFFEPESTEEFRKILAFAREKGKRVKVVGNGHSPSDLACTTDYMISLKKYDKILKIDSESLQVTVQGGCLVKDLNTILPDNGMAFSVLGSVSEVTVAGMMSTGTHGTGAEYGIMSSYVVSMEMMTAAGEVIEISQKKNPDLMSAVLVSLGSLGIILTVTLQCEPAYNLLQTQYPAKLDDVLENLDTYVNASNHFRFFWFPHTNGAICYHASRTKEKPNATSSWFWDMAIGYYLFQILLWISTFLPRLLPVINRFYYHMLYAFNSQKIDRSDKIFNFNCLFKQYVMDWAIPRDKTAQVLLEIRNWVIVNKFPAHFPVEVRFVKGDNILLSPAYGWDACYINLIMFRPFNKLVDHADYWSAFQKIVLDVGGRPHWAKDHKLGKEEFLKLYPKFEEFCKIRENLDPNGMFLNTNLERVFG